MSPTSVNVDRNILLSFNENSGNTDTNQVRKASGLLYNDYTKILSLAGGLTTNSDITINSGDLNVLDGFIVGDVQGNFYGLLQNSLTLSINGSDVVYNNGIEQLLTFYAPITSGTTGNNYYLTPITNGAPV